MANFTSTHTGAVIDAAVTKITATSSSATELNLLDGVTSTTAEINILDGVTSTAAEINILDGVTATTAEINLLDGVTATTTELNLIDGVTATTAEINYIDGVTSNIQTQLNLKAPLAGASLTGTTSFQNLSDGTITITAFADEDDFSSNSATLLATQQSIKAYVDANVNTELIQDLVGAMFTSNTESGITVAYQDGDGTIDLTVATQSDNNFTTTLKNKLDAIEASATADQTASEIRTLVESASDSNVFTDDDHSKLNAIEASADVTDTANVTSAGALMDSELTSIANVKALDQSVVSGATPTFTTTNFTDASNKRLMTDAQETKLDSVESSADVTDTANVTSAGALMDSELTDLAGVKGVTISTLQPKPSEGAFANGDKTKLDAIESGATADQTDEEIQDVVGAMFSSNTETGITATYQDGDGTIDLVVGTLNQDTTGNAATATKIASITNSDIVQLTSSQTLTNKTLTSPVINTGVSGSAILDEDNMASNSATKLSSQQSIKAYVDAEVAGVVDSSPAALNTLNELAAALGDDANFATTTATSLGTKLVKSSNLSDLTNAGTARSNLGVDAAGTDNSTNVTLAGSLDYITLSGQQITRNAIDLTADVTGVLPSANLDADTAHLSGTQTFSGAKTFTNRLTISDAGADGLHLNQDTGATTNSNRLFFTGSATSAIFQEGSDLSFRTGATAGSSSGTERFHLNSSGLQINTGSQLYVDDIYGQTNGTNRLVLDDDTGSLANGVSLTGVNHIYICSDETNNGTGAIKFLKGTDNDLDSGTSVQLAEISNAGDLTINGGSLYLPVDEKLYFGGGNHTYISEDIDDRLRFFVGGAEFMRFTEGSSDLINIYKDTYFGERALWAGGLLNVLHSTHGYISNTSGNLLIRQQSQDSDFFISVNDGGSHINAIQIDSSNVGRVILPNDNQKLTIGAGYDLNLYNNGSVSYISNSNNYFTIDQGAAAGMQLRNLSSDQDITFSVNDGGSQATVLQIDASNYGSLVLPLDNQNLYLGASNDFRIVHNGTDSYVQNYTGNFYIRNNTDDGDIILQSDDGSGGVTAYLTLDGSAGYTKASKQIRSNDNVALTAGTDGDLNLVHDGTDSYVENWTGDLYIRNNNNDKDIILQSDNGSGGTTAYLTLDGSVGRLEAHKDIKFADSVDIHMGTHLDLKLYHDGSNSYIDQNGTGDLIIQQQTNDKDISFRSDDGSGDVTEYFRVDGSSVATIVSKNFAFTDSVRARFGTDDDLDIYHDGSNSIIKADGTGNLTIRQDTADADILLRCDDGSGGIATYLTLDGSAGFTTVQKLMRFEDDVDARFGSSSDLRIRHDGTDSKIDNYTGTLKIRNTLDDADITLETDNGSGGVTPYITLDGSISKTTLSKDLRAVDNVKITAGNADDLQIYHVSDASYISNGTGIFTIRNTAQDQDIRFSVNDGGSTSNILTLNAASSRVGIGTTSPGGKLDIKGSANANNLILGADMHTVGGGHLSNYQTLLFKNTTNETGYAAIRHFANSHNDSASQLRFLTSNTSGTLANQMTIDDTGFVGIGTTSPDANLVVASSSGATIKLQDTGSHAFSLVCENNSNFLNFKEGGGTSILSIDGNNQRLGIGTTSPATKLEVDGILTMEDVSIPSEGVSGHAQMFSNGGEMKVNDASGTITTISPHNFELIPEGASEDMAWSHHSVRGNKKVNVDMMRLARLVEELTGEKLVYTDEQ